MIMSESELQSMRNAAEVLLIDRATIERKTLVSDGQLGTIEVWAPIATNVPCRVAELGESRGNREMPQAGRIASEGEHTIRFPFNTVVNEADRIIVFVSNAVRTLEVARIIEHSFATNVTVVATELR